MKALLGAILLCISNAAWAQVEPVLLDASRATLAQEDTATIVQIPLSGGTPFRVFSEDQPRRIIVEFQSVEIINSISDSALPPSINSIGQAPAQPGWTRLDLVLAMPMIVAEAWMDSEAENSEDAAIFSLRLVSVSEAEFARIARPVRSTPQPRPENQPVTVMLDPGHGGTDPGAQNSGFDEADLMLEFAFELRDMLQSSGRYKVVLTRQTDRFVSLQERVSLAREAQADLFISLHADALAEGRATGATVYTLSDGAGARADAQALARPRDDLLKGVDLSGFDDEVTGVLMELARRETTPDADSLADYLVAALGDQVNGLAKRPRLQAGFSVLRAPDIPSVLIELGFISAQSDLKRLRDPVWRKTTARAILSAIDNWVAVARR